MADPPYEVRKGIVIRGEAVEVTGFFILLKGWAAAATILQGGSQQILKIHLPGDALGTPSMATDYTTEELRALTNVMVAHVPLNKFGRLFVDHPRVAARFLLSVQLERIALMDRLVSIGRTSSRARVATFLLDLFDRLRPLGLVDGTSFQLRVTQEQIGDVLGLTSVHINRTLTSLANAGLIKRSRQHVHLVDVEALTELAARPKRPPLANQPWLPRGR